MGYFDDLHQSSTWIASIQREDGGWGLAPGQESSLVNTAEAVYVLSRTQGFETAVEKGITYIQSNLFNHLKSRGPRIRYVAFSLAILSEHRYVVDLEILTECRKWLLSARNSDCGWGAEARDEQSGMFPTFLAMWAIQKDSNNEVDLEASCQWLLAKASPRGWRLHENHSPSPLATAYALIPLARTKHVNNENIQSAKELLLQTKHWGTEEEVIAGTVWKHCTFASVIPALTSLGVEPYATVLAEGVRYVNTLRCPLGGWNETGSGQGRTVRAQFWAVLALDALQRTFDPVVHVPRIDADRAQETLQEPEFVKFAIQSRWAAILPAQAYRAVAYIFLVLAMISLSGFYRNVYFLPPKMDSVFAIGFLLVSYAFVWKRTKQFRKLSRFSEISIGILVALDLLFGVSVQELMVQTKEGFLKLVSFVLIDR